MTTYTPQQTLNHTHQQIISTFPTIRTYPDGTPILGGYYNDPNNLYIILENDITIQLTSFDFLTITQLDWTDYQSLSNELIN
jgi:hypothetical protein